MDHTCQILDCSRRRIRNIEMKPRILKNIMVFSLALCLLLAACSGGASRSSGDQGNPPGTNASGVRPATPNPAQNLTTPISPLATLPDALIATVNHPLAGTLPFEVIAADAPTDGNAKSLFLALRGDGIGQDIPNGLPMLARQVVQATLARQNPTLLLILYAGEMPSGGYTMQIKIITEGQEKGNDVVVVSYYIQPPDRRSGAKNVLTHPYLIASLSSDMQPDQVRFEEVKP
jgi:hypothetical protein